MSSGVLCREYDDICRGKYADYSYISTLLHSHQGSIQMHGKLFPETKIVFVVIKDDKFDGIHDTLDAALRVAMS